MASAKPRIVVIGAGSASFGLSVLGALLREPALQGSTLALVDTNAENVARVARLAEAANAHWGAGCTIEHGTERRELLPGADYVVVSVAIDREQCWQSDFDIAKRHSIVHYAENGGPGAFFHAARNITLLLPILRDIESLCPEAWLLNFTNPMVRLCTLAARYTKVKTIGICHQLGFGYMMLGVLLGRDLGINVPEHYRFVWQPEVLKEEKKIMRAAMEKIDITAAGTNHFTWMLSIRERATGRDLYPLLWERMQTHEPGFEPLTRHMAQTFGCMPVSGDCHMVEYLPYAHSPARGGWDRYAIQMYPLDNTIHNRGEMWAEVDGLIAGAVPMETLAERPSERVEKVIAAMVSGQREYEPALNLPNRGYISNLPDDAIVEVPAVVDATGPKGVGVGTLPAPVAELCRRQMAVVDLCVEATVEGDRKKALHALALDPMVDDLGVAEALLAEYLEANRKYLPQFS